jgi:hypothetical protein
MDLQNNDHRIFCGANQAQSPHFLLNGKTLKKVTSHEWLVKI